MTRISNAWPHGIPEVGRTARRSRLVTAADIERFTEISGDRNPLHDAAVTGGRPCHASGAGRG